MYVWYTCLLILYQNMPRGFRLPRTVQAVVPDRTIWSFLKSALRALGRCDGPAMLLWRQAERQKRQSILRRFIMSDGRMRYGLRWQNTTSMNHRHISRTTVQSMLLFATMFTRSSKAKKKGRQARRKYPARSLS